MVMIRRPVRVHYKHFQRCIVCKKIFGFNESNRYVFCSHCGNKVLTRCTLSKTSLVLENASLDDFMLSLEKYEK